MYPAGINGRQMEHKYRWSDLQLARLHGYSRDLSALFGYTNFYGIEPKESACCNGVLVPIFSDWDHYALMVSEGIYDHVYNVEDVTQGIETDADLQDKIVEAVVVPENQALVGVAPEYYVYGVWTGIQHWGDDFVQEFLDTGGMCYDQEKYKIYARRQREQIKRDRRRRFERLVYGRSRGRT